jgi:arylsulfatase A-like enzyme
VRALASLVVSLALAGPTTAQERPHIVLMVADDLGWGDVGYHGGTIATPQIDSLAEQGVRLNQFYVQPVCSPTRAALMTGRYPMRYGLQIGVILAWSERGLPLDERILPEALREAGYATAICGKWHLGHGSPEYLPTRRGFDQQYGHYTGAIGYYTHRLAGGHDWHRNDRPSYDEGYATDLIAEAAVRVIATHDKDEPLFLYVPFNAPHTPHQAPQSYIQRYSHVQPKERRVHAAMVTCMDDAIGRILKGLERHGYAPEETLLLFFSDNGGIRQHASNGQLRGGKGKLYEGGVRVPAVMAWKGKLASGGVVDQPLHVVDLYPTLLRLAGATTKQAKPLDGKDFWATLVRGAPSPHEFILHNLTPFHGAIRMGDWKLIHNGHLAAGALASVTEERWELFNVRSDPTERRDLSRSQPLVVAALRRSLEALARQAAEPTIPTKKQPAGFRPPKVWGHPE